MSLYFPIKNISVENHIFYTRVAFAFAFIFLLMLVLIIRLVYLQIDGHTKYSRMAKSNSIKIIPLPPNRGIIYDRKGRVLAENNPYYSLEIIPEHVQNLQGTLLGLQQLLGFPDEKIKQFMLQKKKIKNFASIPLLIMNHEKMAKFAVSMPYYKGVHVRARLVRHYPHALLTSHVVGYVSRISTKDVKNLSPTNYAGTLHVGKTGIEKTYESKLHGQAGYSEIETNAQGRVIRTIFTYDSVPGADIHLTLDIDLQKTAYKALAGLNGAVVAIEVKTGNVLALISQPGFDPNKFAYGIDNKSYKALYKSENKPLFNRALHGQYPPGSTIKPFIGLAGIEYNVINPKHTLFCRGFYQLPKLKHKYRDWKKLGHKKVDLDAAITQSCDVYFYDLSRTLGIDRIHAFLQQFGFGEKTGIDLIGEKSGLLPSKTWKKIHKKHSWYHGETLLTGIGQGFIQVTPLQLAKATTTLANRGKVKTPILVSKINNKAIVAKPEIKLDIQKKNLKIIVSAMTNVIHNTTGTAKILNKNIDYKIAGKTGTSQVFTVKQTEQYDEKNLDTKLKDHALFIGFAPADNPQIAVAVIVENGGHGGSVAAPIAGKIIHQHLSHLTQ